MNIRYRHIGHFNVRLIRREGMASVIVSIMLVAWLVTGAASAGVVERLDPYPETNPRKIPDITGGPADSIILSDTGIIDIVILGDGYLSEATNGDSTRFFDQAQGLYDSLFGSAGIRPYTSFSQAFRVRAIYEESAERASPDRESHYRVKLEGTDLAFGNWPNGDSEEDTGFRDSIFGSINEIAGPINTRRYPAELDNDLGGDQVIDQMRNIYSHVYVIMMIINQIDGKPSGRHVTIYKTPQTDPPQVVRVGLGSYERHEFGHSFPYLVDEYITGGTNASQRNPTPAERSVFNILNVNFIPQLPFPPARCDENLPWPHLAPGGAHNPRPSSLIGNTFAGGTFVYGSTHGEYKCLMNGTHANYFCDIGGLAGIKLRDNNRFCFWCEEIVALRILERTDQLARPGDPADINEKGRTWYALWESSLREDYYDYFNIDSLIRQRALCYDLYAGGECASCSSSCAWSTYSGLPSCLPECTIRDVAFAIFVDGDIGDDANDGSNREPKQTILNAVGAVCAPQRLVLIKPASYSGSLVITQPATLAAGGCGHVIIGK